MRVVEKHFTQIHVSIDRRTKSGMYGTHESADGRVPGIKEIAWSEVTSVLQLDARAPGRAGRECHFDVEQLGS